MDSGYFSSSSSHFDHKQNENDFHVIKKDESCLILKKDKNEENKIIGYLAANHLVNAEKPDLMENIDKPHAAKKIQQTFRRLRARSELIHKYIEKYFDVVSNVSSLNLAKVVYLGEYHSDDRHALRNAWVIDHLFKQGDRVLVEDQNRPEPWIKDKDDVISQVRFVNKAVEQWGWDNKLPENNIAAKNIFILGKCLDLVEEFLDPNTSEAKKKETLERVLKGINLLSIKDQLTFYLNDSDLLERAYLECPQELIAALMIVSTQIASSYQQEMLLKTFSQRQSTLASKVSQEINQDNRQYRKIFLIAGAAHLIQNKEIEKNLSQSLDHPHAILNYKETPLSSEEEKKIERKYAQKITDSEEQLSANQLESNRLSKFVDDHIDDAKKFLNWALNTNQFNGKAQFIYPDGRKFDGEFENGVFKKGKMIFSNGTVCDGEFDRDFQFRKGVIHDASNGNVLEGEFDHLVLKNGKSIYANGMIKEGKFDENGYLTQGIVSLLNGTKAEGEFNQDVFVRGKSTYPSGKIFEGEFHNGVPLRGRWIELDGKIMEGEFAKGTQLIRGKVIFPDKSILEGEFEDGNLTRGKYVSTADTIYEGEFDGDLFKKGTITYADGTIKVIE